MTLKEKFDKNVRYDENGIESEMCVVIADEFAIGFAEWILIIYNEDIIYDAYSKEELLEIYKQENNL